MESGDMKGARLYLDKAGNSAGAMHARAVLCILEGNIDKAKELLDAAVEGGCKDAEHNIRILEL